MTTVGELLKAARLKKNIKIQEVEKETKIKSDFITALEEGDYDKLPAFTYARGFLRNYAQFLGLNTDTVLALFRREFGETSENKLLPTGLAKIPKRRIRFTALAIILMALFILLLSYFFFQYKGLLSGPTLSVNTPHENEVIMENVVTISGKTDPDSTLYINTQVASVDKDGTFSYELPVFEGDFTITILSKNRFGRETRISRIIKVKQMTP